MNSIIFALASIPLGESHSWVACTDYSAAINGQDYDEGNCNGFVRDWVDAASSYFGEDRGWNYLLGSGSGVQNWCNTGYSGDGSDYTTAYPMASYTTGETVRVVWPAKNHANYDCFNFIPDNQMKLYAIKTHSYSESSDLSEWTTIIDWHDGISSFESSPTGVDGVPFQNCPDFCSNTDKAVCYGDFEIDSSVFTSDERWTFMWYWAFNSDNDVYTTCWEADITTTTIEYDISIPICYSGADYNKNTLESGAEAALSAYNVAFTVESVVGTDPWNATLTTTTEYSTEVWDAALCDYISNAFGTGTCTICDETQISTDKDDPTAEPTGNPTPKPTISSGTSNIKLINFSGTNKWWFAFSPDNIQSGYDVSTVEMRDSSSDATWEEGVYFWGSYLFSSNTGFESPLDIRITSTSGDELISYGIITSFDPYDEFDFGQNFDSRSGYTIDNNNNNDNNNTVIIIIIVVSIVILLIGIIIGGICYKKHKQKKELAKERNETRLINNYTAPELI